jgi:hypothetical protein
MRTVTLIHSFLNLIPGIHWFLDFSRPKRAFVRHRLSGSPIPPPHIVKVFWLHRFRRRYALKTFIETGTYTGITVASMLKHFERIYTIELDDLLWRQAYDKFLKYPHVYVIHGNSGELLPSVLENVHDRCLFWLDGHFSGKGTARGGKESPILEELACISIHQRKDHIILIDDANLFKGASDYPAIDYVNCLIKEINPRYNVRVVDNMIQAFPPKT